MNSDNPQSAKVRVLVVEDSAVVREFLTHILSLVPDFQVVGVAHDGEQAIAMVSDCRPDVVTMDIHMPKVDGFEATRRIMETQPVPIVVVSGSSTVLEAVTACRALGAGAVAVEARPYGFGHPEFARSAEKFVETVRLMAGVKVIKRWPRRDSKGGASRPITGVGGYSRSADIPVRSGVVQYQDKGADEHVRAPNEIRIAAIGASTGGPAAIVTILAALPKDLPFPVVIVQHICVGFTAGFGEWLAQTSGLPVHIAADGEALLAGHVYVAPSGAHLEVTSANRIRLDGGPLENGVRPAVGYLFRSVASAFGKRAAAILLTGMGTDGAEALKQIRERGGVTIAQDQASSVVHGMPGEAIRLGAAVHVLPPESIGAFLRRLGGK